MDLLSRGRPCSASIVQNYSNIDVGYITRLLQPRASASKLSLLDVRRPLLSPRFSLAFNIWLCETEQHAFARVDDAYRDDAPAARNDEPTAVELLPISCVDRLRGCSLVQDVRRPRWQDLRWLDPDVLTQVLASVISDPSRLGALSYIVRGIMTCKRKSSRVGPASLLFMLERTSQISVEGNFFRAT